MTREEREREEREALRKVEAEDAKNRAYREKQEDKPHHGVTIPDLPDTKDLGKLALHIEADIFKTYYILMMSSETPPAVKKSCADALADRAKGKPLQEVAQTIKVETKDVGLDKIARMMLFAQRDARERGMLTEDVIDVEAEEVDTES